MYIRIICCCMQCHVLVAGLLRAFSTAATAASRSLSARPQLPRTNTDPARPTEQTIARLMENPIHLFAGASSSLLLLWNTLADLMPILELLSVGSPLLGSAEPTATLGLALARTYAGDPALCGPVLFHVLTTALVLHVQRCQALLTSSTARWHVGTFMS
jgi:hypothetical protein